MDQLLLPGPWDWGALAIVAVAALLPAWLSWRRQGQRAASRAEDIVDALGNDAHEDAQRFVDGAVVTLAGTLRSWDDCRGFRAGEFCAAATCTSSSLDHRLYAPLSDRADELSIEVGDTTIAIEGAVDVVVGAREHYASRSATALADSISQRIIEIRRTQNATHPALSDIVPVMRTVYSGDRVRVRGTLRQHVGHNAAGSAAGASPYRYMTASWRLVGPEWPFVPSRDDDYVPGPAFSSSTMNGTTPRGRAKSAAISIVYDERPRARRMPWTRHLLGSVLAVVTALGTLWFVDDRRQAVDSAREHDDLYERERMLNRYFSETGDEIEQLADVSMQLGRCAESVQLLFRYGQLERAAAKGAECASPRAQRTAGTAYFLLGQFHRASGLFAEAAKKAIRPAYRHGGDYALMSHILARRDQRAFTAARHFYNTDAAMSSSPSGYVTSLYCISIALSQDRSYFENQAMQRDYIKRAANQPNHACRVLLHGPPLGDERADFDRRDDSDRINFESLQAPVTLAALVKVLVSRHGLPNWVPEVLEEMTSPVTVDSLRGLAESADLSEPASEHQHMARSAQQFLDWYLYHSLTSCTTHSCSVDQWLDTLERLRDIAQVLIDPQKVQFIDEIRARFDEALADSELRRMVDVVPAAAW